MKHVLVDDAGPQLLKACQSRQPEPEKPTEAWQRFNKRSASRKQLKESLHIRQNGLCAYCEIALTTADNPVGFHVEHVLPKEKHPALTFEYSNLVLSCFATGGEIKPDRFDPAPISCGHAALKSSNQFDETLFVKPTESNCGQYFSYELNGEVIPHPNLNPADAEKAEHTLTVLNLNCLRLKRLREETITKLYEIFSELQNDQEVLNRFLINELQENKSFISARQQQFG